MRCEVGRFGLILRVGGQTNVDLIRSAGLFRALAVNPAPKASLSHSLTNTLFHSLTHSLVHTHTDSLTLAHSLHVPLPHARGQPQALARET